MLHNPITLSTLFICCTFLLGTCQSSPRNRTTTLALCLVTKDQNADIREWVEYHYSIGVNNLIIFDTNSSEPCINNIRDYVTSGFVHYFYEPNYLQHGEIGLQHDLFNICLQRYSSNFSHIGFIDTDEFIVLKNNSLSVVDVLEPYKSYPGLALNSMFIGSNGHQKRPPGGVLRNYNKCVKDAHVKIIANTQLTEWNRGPHTFRHLHGALPVDTNFNPVGKPWNPGKDRIPPDSLFEVMYINHYVIKSFEDYSRKYHRGAFGIRRPMEFFNHTDLRAINDCEFLSPRKFTIKISS